MDDNVIERERQLIEEVQRELPGFVAACNEKNAEFVLLHQDAFAPKLGPDEIFLLGKAIKYAGVIGKEVRIIPSDRLPS